MSNDMQLDSDDSEDNDAYVYIAFFLQTRGPNGTERVPLDCVLDDMEMYMSSDYADACAWLQNKSFEFAKDYIETETSPDDEDYGDYWRRVGTTDEFELDEEAIRHDEPLDECYTTTIRKQRRNGPCRNE